MSRRMGGQAQVEKLPPEITVGVRTLNCFPQVEKSVSEGIAEVFNKEIDNDSELPASTQDKTELNHEVNNLCREFRERDFTITKAETGCIVLHIQCSSILSLLTLLREYVNGGLDKSLEKLEEAARSLDGCENLRLETVMYEDEFYRVLSNLNFEQFLSITSVMRESSPDINLQEKTLGGFEPASGKEKPLLDVGRVLKRHEQNPLILGKQELKINDKMEVEDAMSTSAHPIDSGDSFSIVSTFGSLESLTSFGSMTTLASSELFGSGRGQPDCFSRLYSEIHLEYASPSGQTNKLLLNLQEIEASSTVVSYAGCTQYTNDVPTRRETILQIKLEEILKRPVCVTEANDMFTIKVSEPRDDESNSDDIANAVKETLKSLEVEITVQLLEINANHADVTIKHLESFVGENKGIKLYRTEEETTILITCQTEEEKRLVSEHVDIIKRQRVVKLESKLSEADYFKLQGFKQKIKQQKAIVIAEGGLLIITGYEEDVQSTLIAVNKIKMKDCHKQRHIPDFVADLMKEKHVHKMIRNN